MTINDLQLNIIQPSGFHIFHRYLSSDNSSSHAKPTEDPRNDLLKGYQTGTETILLVEDLEVLRNVITELLRQLGYHVLSAGSGEEALALSRDYKDEINLLLTDVMMPNMKGPELARKMAARRPQIKVIYLSGYSERVLAPHGVLEAGTVLLHKPFSVKLLAAKLRDVLDG